MGGAMIASNTLDSKERGPAMAHSLPPTPVLGVGLLGLGTVGRAVVHLLHDNEAGITQRAGAQLRPVAALVRDPAAPREGVPPGVRLVGRSEEITANDSVDLVVEAMGGMEPARRYVLDSLTAGKPVITANKQLIAVAGAELAEAARQSGAEILYEATVCSGLPVLRAVRDGCAGDRIIRLEGVLNGTTNYVLSQMEQGAALDEAVTAAQAAGYAEADASADLDGLDAQWKLAILASLAFGCWVHPDEVSVRGIAGTTPEGLAQLKTQGLRLKLLAVAERTHGGCVRARVEPTCLESGHPLAALDGVDNGLVVEAEAAGRIVMTGPGAGGPTAAAAIVADLIAVAGRCLVRSQKS